MDFFTSKSAERILGQQREALRSLQDLHANVAQLRQLLATTPAKPAREPGAGSALTAARAELVAVRAELRSASDQMQAARADLATKSAEVAKLSEENDQLLSDNASLERQIKLLDAKVVAQSETINALRDLQDLRLSKNSGQYQAPKVNPMAGVNQTNVAKL